MPDGYNLVKNDFYPKGYMVPTAEVCPFALCERGRECGLTMCYCCLYLWPVTGLSFSLFSFSLSRVDARESGECKIHSKMIHVLFLFWEFGQAFSVPNGYQLVKNDVYPNGYMVPTTAKMGNRPRAYVSRALLMTSSLLFTHTCKRMYTPFFWRVTNGIEIISC